MLTRQKTQAFPIAIGIAMASIFNDVQTQKSPNYSTVLTGLTT